MVMKKIFDGVFDAEVHANFLKFGRGEYKDKYLLEGKRQTKKWSVKAGAEYANLLVRKCLEKISGAIEVKGVIVSTLDLRDEINEKFVKSGIKVSELMLCEENLEEFFTRLIGNDVCFS